MVARACGGPPLPACLPACSPLLRSLSKCFILRRELWSQGRRRDLKWATPAVGDSDGQCQGLLASGVVQGVGAAVGQGAGSRGAAGARAFLSRGSFWSGQLCHQKPGSSVIRSQAAGPGPAVGGSRGSGLGRGLLHPPLGSQPGVPALPGTPWGSPPPGLLGALEKALVLRLTDCRGVRRMAGGLEAAVPGQRPGRGGWWGWMPRGGGECRRRRWGLRPSLHTGPGSPSAFPVSLSQAAAPGVSGCAFPYNLQRIRLKPAGAGCAGGEVRRGVDRAPEASPQLPLVLVSCQPRG